MENIDSYSTKMTISKVIKFFEKYDIYFTKTMIQNYLRIGILPNLEEKRYYKKKHLVILYLINNLKSIYSLELLTKFFQPIYDLDENFDYKPITDKFRNFYNGFLLEIQEKENFDRFDDETFFDFLKIMAESLAIFDITNFYISK